MKKLKRFLTTTEDALFQDGGGMFLVVTVLVMGLAIIMQVNSIIRITEEVNRQLEKGASVAIKGSILDAWRMDYIARIDTDEAEDIFNDFLITNMHMTHSGGSTYSRTMADGTLLYSFQLDNVEYDEGGSLSNRDGIPRVEADGVIHIPSSVFPALTEGFTFDIPFNVVATNRRIVYEGDLP